MNMTALAHIDGHLLDGLEFCSKVYRVFQSIREAPDGPSRLRMRLSRVEKRLLEELLPICRYVQAGYRPGRYISVRWRDGNQPFDAEVQQHGAYVGEHFYPAFGYIEVTCAMHPNEYLSRELLEKEGTAFGIEGIRRRKDGTIESTPVGFTNKEFVESYGTLVVNQIAKKATMPYPANTTLIVQCTLNTVCMSDEWDLLISRVAAELPKVLFREIYLYDTVCHYSHSVFPRNDAEPCHAADSHQRASPAGSCG